MMKQILKISLILSIWLLGSIAVFSPAYGQRVATGTRCEVGFLYQISYQESWGDSYAVVADVFPDSPAAQAGLRVGDVLLEVDGMNTRRINEDTLIAILGDVQKSELQLKVARFGVPDGMTIVLKKRCYPTSALGEGQIARAFNMYSLEDVTDRKFTMPFTYSIPSKKDMLAYNTFSFPKANGLSEVEKTIQKQLTAKGLKYQPTGGDLVVQVRYALVENPNFKAGEVEDVNQGLKNYRADMETLTATTYPFLSINSPSHSGTHRLEVDIELFDKSNNKIWGVSARERLNESYHPADYIHAFAPLLFSNFPMVRYVMNPVFVLNNHTFRYTGIYYDANDLKQVVWVDKGSPADKAGVRIGDKILAINGLPTFSSAELLTVAYKDFVKDSKELRDPETIYPSDTGLKWSMYWKAEKYAAVAEMIQNPKYKAVFSYLFSHRSYINTQAVEEIVVEIERNGTAEALLITPELKRLDYISQK